MNSTLPITLQPIPVPVGVKAVDINELLAVICQFIAGSVRADVSFFQEGLNDPVSFTTSVFFNTSQGLFKYWSASLGKYLPISQFQPGDILGSFIYGDSPLLGWVVCDGRQISTIQGITQTQVGVLEQIFGAGGSLPTIPFQTYGTATAYPYVYIGAP